MIQFNLILSSAGERKNKHRTQFSWIVDCECLEKLHNDWWRANDDNDGIHRFKLADWLTSLPVNWWLMNCGRCRNYCIFRLFLCTFWFGNGRCTALYGYMRTHDTRTPQCVECIDAGKWGRRRKWWFQFFFFRFFLQIEKWAYGRGQSGAPHTCSTIYCIGNLCYVLSC